MGYEGGFWRGLKMLKIKEGAYTFDTGCPIKYTRFLKIKNNPDQLSDDKKGKLMWNIDF